jgi:hypothetical protein
VGVLFFIIITKLHHHIGRCVCRMARSKTGSDRAKKKPTEKGVSRFFAAASSSTSSTLELADVDGFRAEMNAFLRGGVPGVARLRLVLRSLYIHYRIPAPAQHKLLAHAGLVPFQDTLTNTTSFYMPSSLAGE